MSSSRKLIVNADDFGLSGGVNRGIIEAHENGIVTSASLMVRGAGADEAASYARSHDRLDIGLHIDLGEWTLVAGDWIAVYEVIASDDAAAVETEVIRQVEAFRKLTGRLPTHLDSHQHLHRRPVVANPVGRLAASLGVPLRHVSPIRYCGEFYGQDTDGSDLRSHITVDAIIGVLRGLGSGITEIACHPGYADELPTLYKAERALEVVTLCDPRVRVAIDQERIELTRFSRLATEETR